MIDQATVLGRPYRIVYCNLESEDFGQCDSDKGLIRVSQDSSIEQQKNTILHELLHAILHESGHHFLLEGHSDGHLEESLVRALEHGLSRSGIIKVED